MDERGRTRRGGASRSYGAGEEAPDESGRVQGAQKSTVKDVEKRKKTVEWRIAWQRGGLSDAPRRALSLLSSSAQDADTSSSTLAPAR